METLGGSSWTGRRPALAARTARIQWIDFRQSYEQGLAALLQALQMHLDKATPASPNNTTSAPIVPSPPQEVSSKPEPRPEAEAPWNVPFARNPFFTGRAQLLEGLHQLLNRPQRAALSKSLALSGLGGIGK